MASIVIGIVGAFFALLGLVPFLGIVNFIGIPILALGLLLGIIGLCRKPSGRRGTSVAGTVICVLFLLLSLWRTYVGWKAAKAVASPSSIEKLQKAGDDLNALSESLNGLSNALDSLEKSGR